MDETTTYTEAINDFRNARSQAMLQDLIARLTGESTELLSYEEVRQKLKVQGSAELGLQDVPLDTIVGSVNRYNDFTRSFLPRKNVNQERWARVKTAVSGLAGLDPIEVYKIGEAYFVKDGNHRVSVARQLGATHIQARVTEIRTRVPLSPDVRPDDLILMAEYADFLEKTRLDHLSPEANLQVSVPGQYEVLLEHIDVHRYYMGLDERRDISYEEAVAHWYVAVYQPVVRLIRELGILDNFPGRTEADLYVWIARHRAALEEQLGWKIDPGSAAIDLARQQVPQPDNLAARLGRQILQGGQILHVLDALTGRKLEAGPPPGQWRRETLTLHDERLFAEILVPVNGAPNGWVALDQALVIAKREGAVLQGLHVVPDEETKESDAALAVRAEFNRRCAEAPVTGELAITAGEVSKEICARARLANLVVTNLAYPPSSQPLARLTSSWTEMVRTCTRPILAVPGKMSPLLNPLLAFDGSSKSKEALFVVTYLAGRWNVPVTVVTVGGDKGEQPAPLDEALEYLERHGIQAEGIAETGSAGQAILKVAEQKGSDLIAMGGYSHTPVVEVVLGSVVDEVLRKSGKPILICK
jgi:nucleotide-binding universal stress UspA family protein